MQQVLTLIAAERTPFLRASEVWMRTHDGLRLEAAAYADDDERAEALPASARRARHKELAQRVLDSRLPTTVAGVQPGEPAIALGIPVHDGESLRSVVCLAF